MTTEDSIRHFETQQKRYKREHIGVECPHYANAISALKSSQAMVTFLCNVGDTVYFLVTSCADCDDECDHCQYGCEKPKGFVRIKSTVIKQIYFQRDGFYCASDTESTFSSNANYFRTHQFGKTVFLTKEEAEQKLQELSEV